MQFKELSLHTHLIKGLEKASYFEATPVQEEVLSLALAGEDLYVQSQTGTGKTAAFLIPTIQSLLANESLSGKKALIMVPTRELAVQVEKEARLLSSFSKLKTASFFGGVSYEKQIAALKKGVDILVGTPGRVLDLQESGSMDLSEIAVLVVDEADRMFDMGFYPDLRRLIKLLPDAKKRQTMLFSATLNTYVKNLAWEYTVDAKEITIDADSITLDEIEQKLFHISSDKKMELLLGILEKEKPQSAIVFCNTKKACEIVSKRLALNAVKNEYIMGDLAQSKRLKIIEEVKNGSLSILIATDVAARGIDINDLELVINYDLPNESENYVHRIGRTARAGKKGKAYSFCSEQDVYNLPAIEKYLESSIPSELADEATLKEDKSKGIYIKLDADIERPYEKDMRRTTRSSQRELPRQRGQGSKNTERKKHAQGSHQKTNKTRPTRNDSTKNRNLAPRMGTAVGAEDLSALSFEERMKLYKERYGQGGNTQSQQKKKGQNRQAKKIDTTAKKKTASPNQKSFAKNEAKPKNAASFDTKNKSQIKATENKNTEIERNQKKTETKQKGFLKNLVSFFNKTK
ncbi:MAG: DEAD/DEAH box helicase [Spirochaetota bacterium]|jgi:ATP-dependent RNA helicase RhlB|nr:DEAD/DEAH box helicase [Spirochaetota bacterium]